MKSYLIRPSHPHIESKDPRQDQYSTYHGGEHAYSMNRGPKVFLANAARANHHTMVGNKAISSVARTEIRDDIGPKMDVTKNFSRMPKTYNDPQPNDFGEPARETLYTKSSKAGMAKGGMKRA